jgi:N-acylneuraminate cytidylyltransferase
VIPARGGSKGILHKNIRPLAGKPLIAHSIEQALQSRYITRLVVSTDDPEIGAIARQFGADVVWRPGEISGDLASSESALLHTLEYLQQSENYSPDLLVFLQCTSPLTLAEDIDGTIQVLLDQGADTALAVIPFHYFIWKNESRSTDGRSDDMDAVGINHDKSIRLLRQQREPQYLETGAVYVMRVPGFITAQHRFFGKTAIYSMPPERRLEIDDPVDFQVAEVLLREQQDKNDLQRLPDPLAALVLDFDGVFTDNRVNVHQDGSESVECWRSDGLLISQLKKTGLPILVLSTEKNPVVKVRADKLGLPCLQGQSDKWSALESWLQEKDLDARQVVYVGNDINDIGCLSRVGCGVVPADAHPSVLPYARIILKNRGGYGVVREICDLIITRNLHVPNS